MKLELVSFATCPYVQRAEIVLHEKAVPHETRYVDLGDKPEWFLRISPRGKVPVLVVDGVALFESCAICEYLDEVCPPPRLMPDLPLERARDRGWFQFADDVLLPLYRLMYTTEPAVHDQARADLGRVLARLEPELHDRDYLSGDGTRFGMADVAIAPAFTRLALLAELGLPAPLGASVRAWMERTLARPAVRDSVPPNFSELQLEAARERGSVFGRAVG